MATVTPQGIVGRDLTGWRTLLETRWRVAFGDDFAVDPETPAGGIIGIMAATGAEADEGVVALSNALSPSRALDSEQDVLGELIGLPRHGSTRSRVTLTLAGVTGTTIPAFSRARTSSGSEFRTVVAAVLPAGGSIQVVAEAVELGAVAAPAGSVNQIVTQVAGWETVTNPEDAAPGIAQESNLAYRSRYQASTGRLARGPVDAIYAALIEAGATDFRVEVNKTSVDKIVTTFTIPRHSIFVIVKAGQDGDIAAALIRSKGLGTPTYAGAGARAVTVGAIMFRRPEEVPVALALTIDVDAEFLADGLNEIRRNLADYAAGTWTGGTGQFDTRGFRIGEPVDLRRLQSPINAVPGHLITALAVTDTNAVALPAVTPTDRLYTLAEAGVTITVA